MSEFKGNFLGFTYNGKHSSDLGIVRVSDGSRFNENLLPTMQDKTVPVPGGDGTYYFGSYYTQRQFSVSYAFDGLTDEKIGEIRELFSDKQIHDLIFDEAPYKVWSAKVTGTATLKYVPFIEEDEQGVNSRLYKGEGTIQFTCYYPFARCRFTTKQEYVDAGCENIEEWWDASRIDQGGNFGDVDVPFELKLNVGSGSCSIGDIKWTDLPVAATLNTKTGLVIGNDDGKIYNKYISGNTTAKIPKNTDSGSIPSGAHFTCLYV